ncbi:MAG: uracil-DNA glycosylase [Deltaproteobacteria bacterium]
MVRKAIPSPIPRSWGGPLASELSAPYFRALSAFVGAERAASEVYPPEDDVFAAFRFTPLEAVRVVLLGQDPYHGPGQAHGLCLSVRPGVPPPPSLINMFKELTSDLGHPTPDSGNLEHWARQGVLLLNAVLTVRGGEPRSHRNRGWETFTDAVLRLVDARSTPSVFVLLGNDARKKASLVDATRHRVIEGVHPSPLSAYAGFLGSRLYSTIDDALVSLGHARIDWRIPDCGTPLEKRTRRPAKRSR